jgi:vitamin-K-epoxide reductase (warfarin-sensitive)
VTDTASLLTPCCRLLAACLHREQRMPLRAAFMLSIFYAHARPSLPPSRWTVLEKMHRSKKVQLLAVAGIAIAGYALTVEAHMHDEGYEAMCDISATFSCTEVFKSKYARPLSNWGLVTEGSDMDIGLASAGIGLYSAYFLAACLWHVIPAGVRAPLFLAVASCSATFSVYLLYVLKFVLGDFCIVCTGFHCVNFSMLALALFEFFDQGQPRAGPKQVKRS